MAYIGAVLELGQDSRALLVGGAAIDHGPSHAHSVLAQRENVVRKHDDLVLQLQQTHRC